MFKRIIEIVLLLFLCANASFSQTERWHFADVKKRVDLLQSAGNYKEGLHQLLLDLDRSLFSNGEEWKRSINYIVRSSAVQSDTSYFKTLITAVKHLQHQSDYKSAFVFLYDARAARKQISDISCDWQRKYWEVEGLSSYYFGQWKDAIRATTQALKMEVSTSKDSISYLNTLGLCHIKRGEFQQANFRFLSAYKLAKRVNAKEWIGVLSGNIGSNLYHQGKRNEAIPFLVRDYKLSIQSKQFESALAALSTLVRISIELGERNQAEDYYHKMNALEVHAKDLFSRRKLLEAQSVFEESQGNFKAALKIERNLFVLNDSIAKLRSLEGIERIRFQLEFQKEQTKSRLLNEKEMRYRLFLIASLVLLIITILLGWFIFRNWKRARLIKEMKLIRENEALDQELRLVAHEMQQLIMNLMEKNRMVDALSEELDKQDAHRNIEQSASVSEEDKRSLEAFVLLTDEDWLRFKLLFDRLNPGFFDRLHEHVRSLSNGEVRLAALLRMNLSKTEISRMLGISPESVRKAIFRFRKHANMEDVDALRQFLRKL